MAPPYPLSPDVGKPVDKGGIPYSEPEDEAGQVLFTST
jgi:hypothetical protein